MRSAGSGGVAGLAFAALIVLAGCGGPSSEALTVPPEGARLEAQVVLSARGPDLPDARFDVPTLGARETVLTLRSTEPRAMAARLSCDGPARLHLEGPGDSGVFLRPGATRAFTIASRHEGVRPRLVLPAGTARCTLDWGDGNRLALIGESREGATATSPAATADACPVPPTPGDALATAFFAPRDLAQTCPRPTGAYALYPDEIDALQLRLERLTGGPVSRAALQQGDPDMPLDFSHAPQFDEIVVSYLQFRADTSGYLVARALAFHAARGTKVRIAVSGALALELDKRLHNALATQYPNVQVQYFNYLPRGFAPLRRATAIFGNSHHIKLFAGISSEPGVSFAVVGGRNLHDGFFFPLLEDRANRPFLIDYDAQSINPVNYVNNYKDFEIGLFDRSVVEDVMAQFVLFWNRDSDGAVMPRPAGPVDATAAQDRNGLVRHFVSLPWADGQSQESLFVDAFDAATREIIAISPFVYPTPAIDAALQRAAARGVKIRLVGRIVGDEPAASFVNSMNADYADRRGDAFSFYAYEPDDGRLTHAKLFVIDSRLAIVTSTNLNRRSFVGDSENGFLFLDRAVARDLRSLITDAIDGAGPYPPELPLLGLGRLLNALPFLANQL